MAEATTTTTTKLALNHAYKFEINTTPSGDSETFSRIHAGFDNVSQAINEVLYQTSYLGDEGWGSSEVTGGQYTVSLSGVRNTGDAAQDYIFSNAVKNAFGDSRKTTFKITDSVGDTITGSCTLAKITESGGAANGSNAIAVDVHFNGKPTYTAASST